MIRRYRFPLALVALGAVLNALVVIANGGVMPVVGAPVDVSLGSPFAPWASWELATSNHHLLFLADRWSLARGFSPGDLITLAGCVLCFWAPIPRLRYRLQLRSRLGL